ncbi:hypothetical protein B5M09_011046 [Aphanomyces astaci]|uniref:Uncharacterized protein n=1 Tax=Aphanomyces astaci TaxID=112090 RepID=A0A3R7Y528_APHAT|nr:hypothetical protein B5M09_011046 [Aphanomyces astaci]
MPSSPTHSSIAMVLMNFSKVEEDKTIAPSSSDANSKVLRPHPPFKRLKPGEQDRPKVENAPTGQRAISMEQIRVNIMKRREKLTQEKHERSLMIDTMHLLRATEYHHRRFRAHKSTPTVMLAPRTEVSPSSSSVVPPMSMHAIAAKIPRFPSLYVRDDDIVGSAEDAAAGLLCRYSTGKCPHFRAQKTDGTYLSLCHMHRIRANANQRKLDRKKIPTRGYRSEDPQTAPSSSSSSGNNDSPRSTTSSSSLPQDASYSKDLVTLVRRILQPTHNRPISTSKNQRRQHMDDTSSCSSDDTT